MTGFGLAAAASIAVGLSIGAVTTVGVTLAAENHQAAPAQGPPPRSAPFQVQYGDRCVHGHCLSCDSKQGCLDKLPPAVRP